MNIYVCSPYGGQEENYETAKRYGKHVIDQGHMAVIPHTMLHGVVDDRITEQRTNALALGKLLMTLCDEVWVFGQKITCGMEGEINEAVRINKPIKYIKSLPNRTGQAIAISLCLKEYNNYFTGFLTGVISDDMSHFIRYGVSEKLILHCMGIAARRQKPWIYCKRILDRCLSENVYTVEDFEKRSAAPKQNESFGHSSSELNEIEKMINRGYQNE